MKRCFLKLTVTRSKTYLITKVLTYIPSFLLFSFLSLSIEKINSNLSTLTSGWMPVVFFLRGLFLPSVGYYFYLEINRSVFLLTICASFLLLFSFITLDCLTSMLFLNRLYEKKFKVKLERINSYGKVSVWRIVVRTIIKYITIAFMPPLLLFLLFNKRRLFLHEIISGVCKVEVSSEEKIEQGAYSKEDEGIVFKEEFSDYEEQ